MTAPALNPENINIPLAEQTVSAGTVSASNEVPIVNPIVTEQDIINTYSAEEQFSCQKYSEYQKLILENPTFGYKKAAKFLGIKAGRTRWWHTKGEKKAIPLPLKVVSKLKEAGLIPFYENHKDAKAIFNFLGVVFGDGGIDINLNNFAFISSDIQEIELWKSDFANLFPFASGCLDLIEGGEFGHSYNIRCFDRSVIRFFVALGAPVGDKIITRYTLPKYFSNMKYDLRKSFLDGLLASEVGIPRFVCAKRGSNYFHNFSFSLSKAEFLEKEHIEYLQSVRTELRRFNMRTTDNIRKDKYRDEPRKDGHYTHGYRVFICTDLENVKRFNSIFPLRYAREKKERLEGEIRKAESVGGPNVTGR